MEYIDSSSNLDNFYIFEYYMHYIIKSIGTPF